MYAFFQPRISVAQEEADIKAMIDENSGFIINLNEINFS